MSQSPSRSSAPRVAIVIPTHNRREVLLRNLELLRGLEGARVIPVVVCDGCTDGTPEAIRREQPGAVVVEGDGNLWWSGSINAGIAAAERLGVEFICLLNDDVRPAPDMLVHLLRAHTAHPEALIGPVIRNLSQPEQIWCAGGVAAWSQAGIKMRTAPAAPLPDGSGLCPADWLPGMGTLIPRPLLSRVGGMDAEAFPQYFGDVDFCLRARRKGVPILVCPKATLFNEIEITGLLLPAGPIRFSQARAILTSLRSHSNWKIRWRFWRRHCPPLWAPWQGLRFYGVLFLVMAKKLTWDRLKPARQAQPARAE